MKNLFKLKFKMHRLVNYIFYGIIFIIGFIIGLTMSSAKAYTITTYNGTTIDEEYIYNLTMETFPNFDINQRPYLVVTHFNNINVITIRWFDERVLSSYQILNSGKYSWAPSVNLRPYSSDPSSSYGYMYYTSITYNYADNTYNTSYTHIDPTSFNYESPITYIECRNGNCTSNAWIFSSYFNFNSSDMVMPSSYDYVDYTFTKTLDTSSLGSLEYNDSLFDDNSNFKEVCVSPNKSYAITSSTNSSINSSFDYDYIWFKKGIYGISYGLYDNSVNGNYIPYDDESYDRYWFNSKEYINSLDSSIVSEFNLKGYSPLKNYYNYTAYPFRLYFDNDNDIQQFTIFNINSPMSLDIGNSGTIHGGGGTRIPFDDEIEVLNDNYCFYIKNEYEVTEVLIDEWGDYIGTVPTPDGNLDFDTSYNKDNINTKGLFNSIYTFISHISSTLSLINDTIYSFYLSMPLLLRLFILSVFTILLIKLILGMVVR